MASKSRSTGVGRGNGLGSARTQFKDGMPSANPHGRPKKVKPKPPATIQEALALALSQPIEVTVNKVPRQMPQYQAMIEALLADFPRASPNMKLKTLMSCIELVPLLIEPKSTEPSPEAVNAFCQKLSEAHKRMEEREREHREWEASRRMN